MEKVYDAYSQRTGWDLNTFRFIFEGSRVNPCDTPRSLKLENNDGMLALLETSGC